MGEEAPPAYSTNAGPIPGYAGGAMNPNNVSAPPMDDDINDGDISEIGLWLKKNRLEKYIERFDNDNVALSDLKLLNDNDMNTICDNEYNMSTFEKNRFIDAVRKLKNDNDTDNQYTAYAPFANQINTGNNNNNSTMYTAATTNDVALTVGNSPTTTDTQPGSHTSPKMHTTPNNGFIYRYIFIY